MAITGTILGEILAIQIERALSKLHGKCIKENIYMDFKMFLHQNTFFKKTLCSINVLKSTHALTYTEN